MKIIEGLKKIKDLNRQADDLFDLIFKNQSIMSYETPTYSDQKEKVKGWIQAHKDTLLEIEKLRERIAKTNVLTFVTIEIDGKEITKSIHSWITRRRDLVDKELKVYQNLNDRGLREQIIAGTTESQVQLKIIRFYDHERRDKMKNILSNEKYLIDGKLEVVNAITDIVE